MVRSIFPKKVIPSNQPCKRFCNQAVDPGAGMTIVRVDDPRSGGQISHELRDVDNRHSLSFKEMSYRLNQAPTVLQISQEGENHDDEWNAWVKVPQPKGVMIRPPGLPGSVFVMFCSPR